MDAKTTPRSRPRLSQLLEDFKTGNFNSRQKKPNVPSVALPPTNDLHSNTELSRYIQPTTQKEEDIWRAWLVKTNLQKMMTRNGYVLDMQRSALPTSVAIDTFEAFQASIKDFFHDRSPYCVFEDVWNEDKKAPKIQGRELYGPCRVVYLSAANMSVCKLREILVSAKADGFRHVMLIAAVLKNEKSMSFLTNNVQDINAHDRSGIPSMQCRVDFFSESEFWVDKTSCDIVPTHERISEAEAKRILHKHHIELRCVIVDGESFVWNIPAISPMDTIARNLGARRGDFVKITYRYPFSSVQEIRVVQESRNGSLDPFKRPSIVTKSSSSGSKPQKAVGSKTM